MRVFARLEWYGDSQPEDEPYEVERLVSDDVDLALWLREAIQRIEAAHGSGWQADLHIEPVSRDTLREDT